MGSIPTTNDDKLRAIYRQLCNSCRVEKSEYTLACTIVAACTRELRSGGYTILRVNTLRHAKNVPVFAVVIRTSQDVRIIEFADRDGYIELSAVNAYFPLSYHSEYYSYHAQKTSAERMLVKFADVTIELADPDMMEHLSRELKKAIRELPAAYSQSVNL